MESKTLRDRVSQELEVLHANFKGNSQRINEIIELFITETPVLIEELSNHVNLGNWAQVCDLIHKVKTRYGYIGLDEIVSVMTIWEQDIRVNPQQVINHTEIIIFIKAKTLEVISELRITEFYQKEMHNDSVSMPLRGKLVLIAEDDEVNSMVFDLFVKETGASTLIAVDGLQALELAGEKKPDLIFMDVHMPYYSGLDVIRDLRSVGYNAPIISISASTRLDERHNSLAAGANEFLIKPANRNSIKKALFKFLM